jgi:hypothetical protein
MQEQLHPQHVTPTPPGAYPSDGHPGPAAAPTYCKTVGNHCQATPVKCRAKDWDGRWVNGQSCDGGATCDPHATGSSCYAQCVDGASWKCHSMPTAYYTFLS